MFKEEFRNKNDAIVEMRKEIFELKKAVSCLQQKIEAKNSKQAIRVSESQAEKLVNNFLMTQKNAGIEKISFVEIVEALNLPIEQIEKVVEKLKSKGLREAD